MSGFLLSKKFKKRKIKIRFKGEIEPQEALLDNLAQRKEAEIGISGKKIEVPLSKKVLWGFLLLSIGLILVLFFKTFQFQVLENEKYSALAEENKFLIHLIRAARGVIYDSSGNQLVLNKPSFDLVLDKTKVPESDRDQENILKEISGIIKEDFDSLKKRINETEDKTIIIAQNLDHQSLILLEAKKEDFPGFEVKRGEVREYNDAESFAHIIGYIGKISAEQLKENPEIYSGFDYVGRDGVEKSYEEILRKNPGKLRIERDVSGNIMSKEIVSLPESGKSLILWLDSQLQKKIKEELEKTLKNIGAKKAVGVALDPRNGGVLALVSLPSFDNNLFGKEADPQTLEELLTDEEEPLFSRVIAGKYPTGSTIKPLIAVAALEEKIISATKGINCQGEIEIPHRYDPEIVYEFKDWRTHGWTDMSKAIAESCNVYFYTIGGGYEEQKGLGPSKIKKYLQLFGWASKTRIDLPGETQGFIPSPEWKKEFKKEGWWDGDTYNLSIGQGDISVTPLQVVTAFAAIANRGTLYQPKIAKEIVDEAKNVIEEIRPEVLRKNFVNSENLQIVREGMRRAVSGEGSPHASSVLLNSLPVPAAAKTGTAQTPRANFYHNWITVFAPYEEPEIVLTIMVENVYEAQVVALPIAKEVLQWYFTR